MHPPIAVARPPDNQWRISCWASSDGASTRHRVGVDSVSTKNLKNQSAMAATREEVTYMRV
jgi:hypothetical protein